MFYSWLFFTDNECSLDTHLHSSNGSRIKVIKHYTQIHEMWSVKKKCWRVDDQSLFFHFWIFRFKRNLKNYQIKCSLNSTIHFIRYSGVQYFFQMRFTSSLKYISLNRTFKGFTCLTFSRMVVNLTNRSLKKKINLLIQLVCKQSC